MDPRLTGPLLVEARLDPKPWGGHALARYGLLLPEDGPIGEAVATTGDATVRNGPLAGRSLGDVVATDPEAMLGERGLAATGGRPLFPLLVKLIDAAEHLSVQVHPDDAVAAADDGIGKTEAWHVLDAAPGAVLYLGLQPDVTVSGFAEGCRAGRGDIASCLRRVPAVPGATVLIPAGTAHALGAGVVVYELQQPSDVTYRLDDWGRRDASGNPRELHIDQGLAVLNAASQPEPIIPLPVVTGAGRRQLLAACRHFAMERIALRAGESVPLHAEESPQTLTCLRGEAEVLSDGGVALQPGETAVVPAAAPETALRATAPAVVLRAWVPDLVADIVRPARTIGHDADLIVRLAGPLPDVREAIGRESGMGAS